MKSKQLKNSLLIGVDLQNGFLTKELVKAKYPQKVSKFLKDWPGHLVLSKFYNRSDSPWVRFTGWNEMHKGQPTELFKELKDVKAEFVVRTLYTVWLPKVRNLCAANHIDTVYLFGLDTDACVLKTALDIFESGLRPVVLIDLCGSSAGSARHKMGRELLEALIGNRQVITSNKL